LTDIFDYVWYWKKWLPERTGQKCKITACGAKNAIRVEFEDGFRVITNKYAVRKR